MIKKICNNPEIYEIHIPLPENPLRELNSYLLRSGGETLLVDTGFRHPVSLQAMRKALEELQVDVETMRIFLTHLHTDHIGSVCDISQDNTIIYMSEIDYRIYYQSMTPERWDKSDAYFRQEGFPWEGLKQIAATNPARKYMPDRVFKAYHVTDGMEIYLGNTRLICVKTNGHTPGHYSLYLPEEEIMFLGDHVLFDITPNISCWMDAEDSLGDYMDSLEKIKMYPMQMYLPGHRSVSKPIEERIEEIKEHHKVRIEATRKIVQENPGLNADEVAARLKWSMRGKSWDEFPMEQKWFAVGETIAHLDYLRVRGELKKQKDQEIFRYYPE